MHVPDNLNEKPIKEGTKVKMENNEYIQYITKFKYLGSKVT